MSLLNKGVLKPQTEREIERLGLRAEQIADRWVSGWMKQTLQMEKDGTLLPRLKERADYEGEILAKARVGGELNHLADHEIAELYDLNAGP